jgi:hypothetical protein
MHAQVSGILQPCVWLAAPWCFREQGSLEDAATAAQRQLDDCRLALAAAESNCRLAQAAAEAVAKERKQLMSQLTQEMNKSTIFEQVGYQALCVTSVLWTGSIAPCAFSSVTKSFIT